MAWNTLLGGMLRTVVGSLNDGSAQYQDASGAVVVAAVPVIIDRNLMQNGPDGLFRSEVVGITWRKCQLAEVERGGVFTYGTERMVVEDTIADDGHMVTAACMVQP